MDTENIIKKIKPLDIVIFHVGGVGGYGPIDKIVDQFAQHVIIACFDANFSEDDLLIQEQYCARGARTVLISKCVGDVKGKQRFYINKHPESSSLFPPSPQALEEHVLYQGINTWGENCEVDHIVNIDTITFDGMVKDGALPAPDIFSMDAQGAELRIMRGGRRAIENVLCVITEIEFWEIYQGQDLFCAQKNFLSERGFRLVDILNTQYWHPAPAAGLGFLTVGEALFFRDAEKYCSQFQNSDFNVLLYKLMKLAAIAYSFRRFSYSSKIVTLILEKFGEKAKSLFLSDESFKPILDTQQYMQLNHNKYLKNNQFFYNSWYENILKKAKAVLPKKLRSSLRDIKRFIKKNGRNNFRKF